MNDFEVKNWKFLCRKKRWNRYNLYNKNKVSGFHLPSFTKCENVLLERDSMKQMKTKKTVHLYSVCQNCKKKVFKCLSLKIWSWVSFSSLSSPLRVRTTEQNEKKRSRANKHQENYSKKWWIRNSESCMNSTIVELSLNLVQKKNWLLKVKNKLVFSTFSVMKSI